MRFPENCIFVKIVTFGARQLLEQPKHSHGGSAYDVDYRYTVISPGYKIPGYFSELSSGKYTAQFKNFTTARMHRHMYGFEWHFGVIFPSQDTIWSIILFTMYYFTAINIFLSLHYTEILNSIIIPSIPYRTRHARSLSLRATQFWEKTNSQQTLTYICQFYVLNRSINSTLTRFIIKLAYNNYQFLSFIQSCFQDYRVHLKSYQREAVSKKFTAKVLPTENLDRW